MKTPFVSIGLWGLSLIVIVFWTWPSWQEYSSTKEALRFQETELQSRENYFAQLASVNQQLQTYAKELARLDAALPASTSLPELYDTLQDIAASSGLVLTAVSAVVSEETDPKEIEVSLTLEGSYAGLKEFLEGVQTSSRFLAVQSLDLATPKEGGRFEFHVKLIGYSY